MIIMVVMFVMVIMVNMFVMVVMVIMDIMVVMVVMAMIIILVMVAMVIVGGFQDEDEDGGAEKPEYVQFWLSLSTCSKLMNLAPGQKLKSFQTELWATAKRRTSEAEGGSGHGQSVQEVAGSLRTRSNCLFSGDSGQPANGEGEDVNFGQFHWDLVAKAKGSQRQVFQS